MPTVKEFLVLRSKIDKKEGPKFQMIISIDKDGKPFKHALGKIDVNIELSEFVWWFRKVADTLEGFYNGGGK